MEKTREIRCCTTEDLNCNWVIPFLEMADSGFTITNEAERRSVVVTSTWRGKYLFFKYDATLDRMDTYGNADEASIAYGFLIGAL